MSLCRWRSVDNADSIPWLSLLIGRLPSGTRKRPPSSFSHNGSFLASESRARWHISFLVGRMALSFFELHGDTVTGLTKYPRRRCTWRHNPIRIQHCVRLHLAHLFHQRTATSTCKIEGEFNELAPSYYCSRNQFSGNAGHCSG